MGFNGSAISRLDRFHFDYVVMPHKQNAARRHHIAKMEFRVTNWPEYEAGLRHSGTAKLIIPPRLTAVQSGDTGPPSQRDRHIMAIAERGRLNWQAATSYGKRALIETTIGRYKTLIGPRLRARWFAAQQTEVAIGCAVLNCKLASGRPESGRRQNRQS
jgi:hypothetical protein